MGLCRCPASDCCSSIAVLCNQETSHSNMMQAVSAGRPVDVTCACGHAFCFACLAPAHEPATCQQVGLQSLHPPWHCIFCLNLPAWPLHMSVKVPAVAFGIAVPLILCVYAHLLSRHVIRSGFNSCTLHLLNCSYASALQCRAVF